ncbi:MAG: 2-oxoacid:acceptor oxidoreductase subunit alpha, partial [Thermoplasmata archaeon]|nr:2-oxoacid:acceptor oxidoreductase subunit alpha [Thermoplasmata archaeon]
MAGIPLERLQVALADSFGKKKGDVVDWNLGAAADGYQFAKEHTVANDHALPAGGAPKLLMTGNQAIALGAAAAGLKFLAQYPMTPASGIMHWLAAHSHDLGIVVKQAEDELAAINMAIGASFGGVRSMTATSGGGFALMVEALGMAGMTETPLVVVESQRSGPSTGLPTKTEQGDLNMMLGAGQGEFPRAILAPANPAEAYRATVKAFELAEDWQTPILLASDLHLSENYATVDREEIDLDVNVPSLYTVQPNGGDYKRYAYTESGVSPRSLPGQPGLQWIAGSDEHDEKGHLVSDIKSGIPIWVAERTKMMNKRMHKLAGLEAATDAPLLEGPESAPLTFIAWGSTVGAIRDATVILNAKGMVTNLLYVRTVYPLHAKEVARRMGSAQRTLLIEANFSGQLGRLIRAETGLSPTDTLFKYDGEPFWRSWGRPWRYSVMAGISAPSVAPTVGTLLPMITKSDTKPTWCPGCGDFSVVAAVEMAVKKLKIPSHNIVIVSGIGCSSNLPHFLSSYGFHGIHGRALPIAEGVRWANHGLTVIATGGDGDGFGIGCGHFVHTMRR